MKNNEKLADLIGKCDDKFIELSESETTPVAKKRRTLVPFAAAAACICLVGTGIYIYSRQQNDIKGGNSEAALSEGETLDSQPAIYNSDTNTMDGTEIAWENDIYEIPQWDEMPFYSQFPCFEFNGFAYSASGPTLDTVIGERLGTAQSNNVDIYTNTDYNAQLEIFAITSVDSDYAVAVKCPDDTYAVYTNCHYETATLGDLIKNLDLDEHMRFDALYLNTQDEMTASRFILDLSNVDTSCIWEFLKGCADAESMGDYTEFSGEVFMNDSDILDEHIDFAVYSDVLGFGNLSFCFTKGGYITTNIISTGGAFYIGIDKINELVSILSKQGFEIGENATLSTNIPPVEDTDLTASEMWASLQGYWNGADGRFCRFEAAEGDNAATFATAFWESEWGDDNGYAKDFQLTNTDELTATVYRYYSEPEQDSLSFETCDVVVDYSELKQSGEIHVTYNGESLGTFTFAGETTDDAFAAYAGTNAAEENVDYDSLAQTVYTAVSVYVTEYNEDPSGKDDAYVRFGTIGESGWNEGDRVVSIEQSIDRFTNGEGNGISWAADCDHDGVYGVYLFTEDGKSVAAQYPEDADFEEFVQRFWGDDLEHDSIYSPFREMIESIPESARISLGYNPVDENTNVYIISEIKEQMGEEPLALSQSQANSILQKISSLELAAIPPTLVEYYLVDGGGIIFEIQNSDRYNFIGDYVLCVNGIYYWIISDTAELINELTALLTENEPYAEPMSYSGDYSTSSDSSMGVYLLDPPTTIFDFPTRVYYLY